MKSQLKGSLLLLITAIIWGCAFVAQSAAMDSVGPFTFMTMRSVLGAVILIPVIKAMDVIKKNDTDYNVKKSDKKTLWFAGIVCGILLCTASCLQQIGMVTTAPGKAGFITAMYIIFVPIFGLFMGKKVSLKIWLCLITAVIGLYFLCMDGALKVSFGDTLVLLCAFAFSFHILFVDKFSQRTDGVRISSIQFAVCALISAILMFIFEKPDISSIISAAVPILYAGIGSSGIGYTFQILGQKYTQPTLASLIMSLESVFAVIAQVVLTREVPSEREILGCILMFSAIIVSQIPGRTRKMQ